MKTLNPKNIIKDSKIIELMAAAYSQKLGMKYDDVLLMFNKKVDQKLNEIGKKIHESCIVSKEKSTTLDQLSSEEFFKDKTMIREE